MELSLILLTLVTSLPLLRASPAIEPTVGGCNQAQIAPGFTNLSSISYYGWMGSACDCGNNAWEWSGSNGLYYAAVNQAVFAGTINPSGQPNCGAACGLCYELQTTGINAYNGGVGSGSTITVLIVDACFSAGDHWCGSTAPNYLDSSGCGVHFDIQTGAPGSNGVAPVGSDGQTWNYGGQIVSYKPTNCPPTMEANYKSTCTCPVRS